MGPAFPIDAILPELKATLAEWAAVILQAPPGAGKTTRVPLDLLDSPIAKNGVIIMLEPRRLAAVNAARWMAQCLGEEVGQTVGYAIRFERRISKNTRIEVVTEGILTRRLQSDPELIGVSLVIFDEFHERSIHADTSLALCREIQENLRPDLKILLMSATLDPAPLARLLGQAPVLTVQVPTYPVAISYQPDNERDLALRTARGICRAFRETSGDILAFLPGSGEIRRCADFLANDLTARPGPAILPLYGDLSFADQQRALQPSAHRRIILATNIAETSLTIAGVSVIVDSGMQRQLHNDAGKGINRLITERVSAAAATQRAGRAGRLGPGVCYRLWSQQTQASLLAFTPPEICRIDLTELCLQLALWGVADPSQLVWLDPPPAGPYREAQRLLQLLGAIDAECRITRQGREMATYPVHPRLARMLLLAGERGLLPVACDLAALLSERDILRSQDRSGSLQKSASDVQDRLDILAAWRRSGRSGGNTDSASLTAVDRTARQLARIKTFPAHAVSPGLDAAALLLLWAYPDRLARQREPGSDRYLLASGKGGVLSRHSAVSNAPYLIATSIAAIPGQSDVLIHQAHAVGEQLLRNEFAAQIGKVRSVVWDSAVARVVATVNETLWGVVLSSRQAATTADEVLSALLSGIIAGGNLEKLPWTPAACQFCWRVELLRRQKPDQLPDFSTAGLLASVEEWLGPQLRGVTSLEKLGRVNLVTALSSRLNWQQQRLLDEQAPMRLLVPSGSQLQLEYGEDGPPILAVKLQEMFGLGQTPCVAWGRQPILLHLLSPAGRPIQVTADLRNFWDSIYPQVKKELKGRYPKHPWPDDPWSAIPTRKTTRALKR